MDSYDDIAALWSRSSSRSFYNAPEYATFSAQQGNEIKYLRLGTRQEPVLLPYARPTVWTYWRSTRIPIPPQLGPKHSIYYGVIMPELGFSASELLTETRQHWRSLAPHFSFIQPVLLESGPAEFLDEFCEAVAVAGLESSETESQVLQMPPWFSTSVPADAHTLSFDEIRGLPEYETLGASYAKKRRYDLRRAEQLGVRSQVDRIVSDEHATEVYSSIDELHRESWTRTGLGPHTTKYWVDFSRMMRESGGHDLVTRSYGGDGELLAVVVVHVRGKSVFYQMNSSSLEGHRLGANPLTLHTAIVTSGLWGAEYFELGRASVTASDKAKSVHAYKAEYGGEVFRVPNFVMSGRSH